MLLSCSMTQRGHALWFLRSLNKVMFRRLLSLQLLSYYNSIRKTFGAKQDSLARVCFCYSFSKMLPSDPSSWQIQFQYLHKSDFFFFPNPHQPPAPLAGCEGPSGPGQPGQPHSRPRQVVRGPLAAMQGVMPQGSDGERAPGQALRGCSHLPESPGSNRRNLSPMSPANIQTL